MESFQILYLEKYCGMPELRVGIIADDLTGAADSSAPFAQRGAQCAIKIIGNSNELDCSTLSFADVLSVSSCCRDLSCMDTNTRFKTALGVLQTFSPELMFWKVDSTLRGHLQEQRRIIQDQYPEKVLVICPAFPTRGRRVIEGNLIAEGIQKDVVCEFGLINLPKMLVTSIDQLPHQEFKYPGNVIVLDAESDEELDKIAGFIVAEPHQFLPVGSAGLSAAIARQIWHNMRPGSSQFHELTLICIGSQHPASRAQANALRSHPDTYHLPPVCSPEDILQARASNKRAVVWTSPEEQLPNMPQLPSIASLSGEQRVHIIATGGNTAEKICAQMNINTLHVVSEIETGVALTTDSCSQFQLTMKSGAFGDVDLLVRLAGLEMQ